jgi:hypothetical protein
VGVRRFGKNHFIAEIAKSLGDHFLSLASQSDKICTGEKGCFARWRATEERE